MFKPKKEGRLSRRMGRLICLFWYPAMTLLWIGFILLFVGLFNRSMLDLSSHCLYLCMPLLLISFILLLFFPCPHCGRPQIMHRYQRIARDGFWGDPYRKFIARWKDTDGGFCVWCDYLMKYDDVE